MVNSEVITEVDVEDVTGIGDGVMAIATKTDKGYTLTQDYGFTIEEENGKVVAFDLMEHPDLGITLLFGNQVFVLKFWDTDDLEKGLSILSQAIEMEIKRRKSLESKKES